MYISVKAVVIDNDHVLSIKKTWKNETKYILTGGHWDFPELFSKGAEREAYEETGVKVRASKLKHIHFDIQHRRVELYYICRLEEGRRDRMEPTLKDAEVMVEEWIPQWVHLNEILSLPIKSEGFKCIIQKILRRDA